jgi:hypothetical protein
MIVMFRRHNWRLRDKFFLFLNCFFNEAGEDLHVSVSVCLCHALRMTQIIAQDFAMIAYSRQIKKAEGFSLGLVTSELSYGRINLASFEAHRKP